MVYAVIDTNILVSARISKNPLVEASNSYGNTAQPQRLLGLREVSISFELVAIILIFLGLRHKGNLF